MIIFFNIRGIVHVDCVPEGQTVNQVYYKEVLTDLKCGRTAHRVLHQNNVLAHNALSVQTFLTKHKITML